MTAARAGAGRVSLGVDFGATGVRALFAGPGQQVRRLDLPAAEPSWLRCAPAAAGVLPVTFPSLKSLVGSGGPVPWRGEAADVDTVVVRLLRGLRERVEEQADAFVAQTVVSVPASFQSAQRQALRDAADAAGLTPVRLISDSMAAVMGHTTDRDSGTFLVYGMGYEGFEIGLVRGVRGHCRALGYAGAATSGGRAFDEAALESAVRLLLAHRGPASVTGAPAEVWLGLRERAERARKALTGPAAEDGAAVTDFAALTLDLGTGPALRMGITRPNLDAFLEPHVRRTVRRAHALLDESAVPRADVDTLLLVGGGTLMEQVRSGVAGLGRGTAHGPPELLALGALKHAVRLAGGGAPSSRSTALEEGLLEPADPARDTLADAPALTASLFPLDAPPDPLTDASAAPRQDVAHARDLVRQGRRQEAVALLRDIVTEARELLAGLEAGRGTGVAGDGVAGTGAGAHAGAGDSASASARTGDRRAEGSGPPEQRTQERQQTQERRQTQEARQPQEEQQEQPSRQEQQSPRGQQPPKEQSLQQNAEARVVRQRPGRGSERQLARARLLLEHGRYEHAVQVSHQAWQEATALTDRADVLDAMIDVHCAAAMADMAPDHFADAERWLRCAYGHDPTNERVRGLLARRTFRHAEELHRIGARDEAIEALGKCLMWDREHPGAEALSRLLGRDGRNRRGRGDVLD
ncbi:Hsp70 family protein [Streptomyces flavofungini]|uniref:Hsp70 family protein n=1 Tax=Streptomyces flavofungini TaxID=68200 RepID=UPI0025B01AA8|nr:Hsp70 family protein [Streptomyces flavofungini]WJV45516.1 Hsp70 family protein [Streptomyces flavofungini]